MGLENLDKEQTFQLALAITTGILANSNTMFVDPIEKKEYRPKMDFATIREGTNLFFQVMDNLTAAG